jgi:hypothetical protein
MVILHILWLFGIFSLFWYFATRKIWQSWVGPLFKRERPFFQPLVMGVSLAKKQLSDILTEREKETFDKFVCGKKLTYFRITQLTIQISISVFMCFKEAG